MPILTSSDYIGASKQVIAFNKTASRTTVAGIPFSLFNTAGNPGAGVLDVGNTANGIVPTDSVAGYPVINTITGTGYLSNVNFANSVASRLAIYDCLFSAGAYSFNANTTLTSQPSYISRLPNSDYKGTELWIEAATAFTGTMNFIISYTNQDGVAGKNTLTVSTGAALIVGRMMRVPLASGDSGIQKIESVIASNATAGTFNIHVMRKLWEGRVNVANNGDRHGIYRVGMPIVYDTSALRVIVTADSTASGLPCVDMEIAQA